VSPTSPFDELVAGRTTALGAAEVAGLQVFLGKGRCVSCHKGPNLTDDDFHNLGVPQSGDHVPPTDNGRFADIPPLVASPFNDQGPHSDDRNTGRLDGLMAMPPESTKGQFRTPSLRNVGDGAPYMHAGQLATLEDVVEFYDRGGGEPPAGDKDTAMVALNLTATEKANLVAFLRALKTAPLPASLLTDTSAR
jgi:cytochrome c peroxidase